MAPIIKLPYGELDYMALPRISPKAIFWMATVILRFATHKVTRFYILHCWGIWYRTKHPTNIRQNYTEDIYDVRGGDFLSTIYIVHHVASFHVDLQEKYRFQFLQMNRKERNRESLIQSLERVLHSNVLCTFLET